MLWIWKFRLGRPLVHLDEGLTAFCPVCDHWSLCDLSVEFRQTRQLLQKETETFPIEGVGGVIPHLGRQVSHRAEGNTPVTIQTLSDQLLVAQHD